MRVLAANGDFDVTGLHGDFDLVLLNSRDHADPWGDPHTTRLIIGGTISELGFSTIGIAESVDPGNFAAAETAVVLLDLLSEVPSNPNSLNQFAIDPSRTKIDVVATGVGNVAAHEAGHLFAAFHTDQTNAARNVMDQGGNLANTVGVGADLAFGTADDADVDFGDDAYVPNEGFTGTEDTLNAVAFGLSTGALECPVVPLSGCRAPFRSTLLIKDKLSDKGDLLQFNWQKGAATTFGELGDPSASALYRICVYDAAGLVRHASAPAGGICKTRPCWKRTGRATSPTGWAYRDSLLTPDGTSVVNLKSGVTGVANVQWKAKGVLLDDGALGLVPPVTVQVSNTETAVCFAETFTATDVQLNRTDQFKAKAQ
jgi:hypothetical protein